MVMKVLFWLGLYSPNAAHGLKPARSYSDRDGANAGVEPVSRLNR
jgi:hypothetical protein